MKIEPNNIYLGDSYELIKEIPSGSVDLIYTDIPYDFKKCGYGSGLLKNETRRNTYKNVIGKFDKGIKWEILEEFVRVLKHIYIYIWCSKAQIPYLLNYFIEKGCLYEILVWCKKNPTPFANNCFLPDLEYCLVFREPSTTKLNDGMKHKSKWYLSGTNVLDKKYYIHPTIKPLELVERHLLHSSKKGDVILDPFVGSGTTALACKHLNRQYIGFEIDERYYNIAKDRLEGINAKGEMNLFDI